MKSEREIREKINELMDKLAGFDGDDWAEHKHEYVCNQIDALLWVIGDGSGKPI